MVESEQRLTLLGHIHELRKRLTRSVIAVVIGIIIAFIFYQWIFYYLTLPAGEVELIFIKPTEMLGITMKVCLFAGLILAMPYLTLQGILFIRPALTKREEKYVYLVLPWIALMFIGGVVFGYFVLVPPAMNFLLNFGSEIATPQITIDSYISLITRLLLAIGLVFEMPVVTTFMARIGILKPEWLSSRRKIAAIGAFVLAAIITPTFDPINQTLLALPLIVLYELSIWLAKLVYRRKNADGTPVETGRPTAGALQILMLILTGIGGLFIGVSLFLAPDGNRLGWTIDMLQNTPFADFSTPGLLLFLIGGVLPAAFAYYLIKRYSWAWAGSLIVEIIALAVIIGGAWLTGQSNLWLAGTAAWGVILLILTLIPSVRKYYKAKPAIPGNVIQ